jgi:carbon storage regulator
MLLLYRSVGERIVIGEDITVEVLSIERGKVRLGFTAPRGVPIYRFEVVRFQYPQGREPGAGGPRPARRRPSC